MSLRNSTLSLSVFRFALYEGKNETQIEEAVPLMAPIVQAAAYAKANPAWRYHELPTGHVPLETIPQALAHLLHESAQPFPSAA